MKKLLLCVFLCLTMLVSCSNNSNDSVISDSVTDYEEVVTDTETAKDLSVYLTETNEENLISVKIPVFEDKAKDQLVYDYICGYFSNIGLTDFDLVYSENKVDLEEKTYSDYYIDVDYEITRSSSKVISIVFKGILNQKNAAHPMHLFFSLNIAPDTNERIFFKDSYVIDKELFNCFAAYARRNIEQKLGGWPENLGEFSEDICTLDSFLSGMKSEKAFFSYYTDNGVGISFPVPFALGNHIEAVIPYANLKSRIENIDTDTEIIETDTDVITDAVVTDDVADDTVYYSSVVVKGKVLSSACYFKVYPDEHYAEVPMTSIMRALGAEVSWDGSVFVVSYNGTEWKYDTKEMDYGLPLAPGTQHGVRNHIGEELIFDDGTAYRTFKFYFGVILTIDYENGSIVVK